MGQGRPLLPGEPGEVIRDLEPARDVSLASVAENHRTIWVVPETVEPQSLVELCEILAPPGLELGWESHGRGSGGMVKELGGSVEDRSSLFCGCYILLVLFVGVVGFWYGL